MRRSLAWIGRQFGKIQPADVGVLLVGAGFGAYEWRVGIIMAGLMVVVLDMFAFLVVNRKKAE
jgi:hypothetical protein